MSLFLGNLSSRIRRDELVHVFRRFGRCNVQLKDGYGFVVYAFPGNAQNALQALRGKSICGEPISLSWSNKQPRPFKNFSRGSRLYEPPRGRNPAGGKDYGMRRGGLLSRQEYKFGTHQRESDGGRHNAADMIDRETIYRHADMEDLVENHQNPKEGLVDEGGTAEPNLVDNDRWGEPIRDQLDDNKMENGADFDRYEPYHGYNKRDEDENHERTVSYGSPTRGGCQEKAESTDEETVKHPDNPKPQKACYICGQIGHIMRNCPRADATRDHLQDDEIDFRRRGEGGLRKRQSKSHVRIKSNRDPVLSRRYMNNRWASGFRKTRRLPRSGESSPVSKEANKDRIKKHYQGKKRRRREHRTPEKHSVRKSRLIFSHACTDHTGSRSRSRSLSSKYISGISSRSRSISLSSSSMSSSTSSYSRSKSSRARSRARSSSPIPLSLSISPGRPQQSSHKKLKMDATGVSQNCSFDKDTFLKSENLVVEHQQLLEGDVGSDNSKSKNTSDTMEGNLLSSFKIEVDMNKDHYSQQDHGTQTMSNKHPCTSMLEHCDFTAECTAPEDTKSSGDPHKPETLFMELVQAPDGRSSSQVPVSPCTNHITGISSQEMHEVLKHYGLACPEENEKYPSVEAYFGSARLWPWEIVYYRRLKKGPISTENYARRIAQNREFGIVDKYIRSSSGWGEVEQNNS